MIYLNDKQVRLATWSKEDSIREEVLLDHILSLSFSFYNPKKNVWESSWPSTSKHPPALLKLSVKEAAFANDPPLVYTFFFTDQENAVEYMKN